MHIWQKWISWVAVAGGLVAAILLLTDPYMPQWGALHESHTAARFQQLNAGQTLAQTFLFEYPRLNGVRLMLDTARDLPSGGTVKVTVTTPRASRTAEVPLHEMDQAGNLFVALAPEVQAAVGTKGALSLSLVDTPGPVFFRYQIDSTKYADGEMTHSGRAVQGDLAFALHYLRPALGVWWRQIVYALLIVGASLVVAWGLRYPWWKGGMFARRDYMWAALFGVTVFAWYAGWLVRGGVWLGPGDFVKDVSYLQSSVAALSAGAWPTWSHLTCGGMPLLGNPESNALSAGMLLAMVMPPETSLWVLLALEAGVGAAGSFLLARSFGLSRWGSGAAALVPVLSGAYPYRIVEGFTMIGAAVAFVPWTVLGVLQAWRKQGMGWAVVAGLGLTAMFWRGEVHILAGLLLVLGILTLIAVWKAKHVRPLLMMAVVGAVFFLGGSVKVLAYGESSQFFAAKYRPYVAPLIQSRLLDDVFLATHSRFYPVDVEGGKRHEEWANFGAYVGWPVIILAALGAWRRGRWWWFVVAGLLVVLVLSEGTVFHLWLSQVRLLAGLLRMPTRFLAIALVFGGVMAGAGLDRVVRLVPSKWMPAARVLVLGGMLVPLLAAHLFIFGETTLRRVAAFPASSPQPALAPHQGIFVDRHAGVLLRQGYVLPKLCADVLAEPDFLAEEKVDNWPLTEGEASLAPNAIRLADVTGPTTVTLRERYVPGLVASRGVVYEGPRGEIVVRVPEASSGPLELKFTQGTAHTQQFLAIFVLLLLVAVLFLPRRALS